MLRSFLVGLALASALALHPTASSNAQAPNLYWTQHSTETSTSACIKTGIEALNDGLMYNVTTGAKKEAGAKFVTGSNSNLSAVIACSDSNPSITTVIVAGAADRFTDATILGDFLSKYMLGERDATIELSSSEAPVKMHEWLSDEWCLGCEGSETEKRYSGQIIEPARSFRVRVLSGRSESGDGSVEVLVYDPNGKLVLTEASKHDDWAEWRVGVVNWGHYEIVLRSLNASADSDGTNKGEIQVLVR